MKLYLRTPLTGNEYKVCDEHTDKIVAIFFDQQEAVNFIELKTLAARSLTFLADLNGSDWIKGDGVGELDMKQRAKALQQLWYRALNGQQIFNKW
jgi:hypothetical protein